MFVFKYLFIVFQRDISGIILKIKVSEVINLTALSH